MLYNDGLKYVLLTSRQAKNKSQKRKTSGVRFYDERGFCIFVPSLLFPKRGFMQTKSEFSGEVKSPNFLPVLLESADLEPTDY